jgi:tetratricopeptide (TPR) repeat protein
MVTRPGISPAEPVHQHARDVSDRTVLPLSRDLDAGDLVARYLDDRRFVPRPWLSGLVRARLAEPECRIVLITAEPGFGKTAFMAWLTTQLGSDPVSSPLRYFIRSDSVRAFRSPYAKDFLLAIGHQLARRRPELFLQEPMVTQRIQNVGRTTVVGLKDTTVVLSPFVESAVLVAQDLGNVEGGEVIGILRGVVYADPPVDDLFRLAIGSPAELLAGLDPEARIVILLDGADEARWATGSATVLEWLASDSPELPPNVRLVIASRPDPERFRQIGRRHEPQVRVLTADRASADIRRDLNVYTQKFLEDRALAAALASLAVPASKFARQIVSKADGNFQYLAAFFRAIEDALHRNDAGGEAQPLDVMLRLEGIPQGLDELYAYFIERVKQRIESDVGQGWFAAWEASRQMLGVLAVAREPLSREQIGMFSAVEHSWLTLCLALLGQFLEERDGRYQLYHSSLPEFLVSERTRQEHPDQWIDAAESNFAIGSHAIQANEGRWSGATDRYVLGQTSGHLRAALRLSRRLGSAGDAQALRLIQQLGRDRSFLEAQAAAFSDNPELPLATLQDAAEASAGASEAVGTAEFLVRRVLLRDATVSRSPLGALSEPGGLARALELAEMFPGPAAALWVMLIAWELADGGRSGEAADVLDHLAARAAVPVFGTDFTAATWLLGSLAPLAGESFVALAQRLLTGQGLTHLVDELIFVGAFDTALGLCRSAGEDQPAGTDRLDRWSRWRSGACYALASALLERRRWAQAREAFELAVSSAANESDRGPEYGRIAEAWAAAGRATEAVEAFRSAQAGVPWLSGGLPRRVAEAQAWAGDLRGALDTVKLAYDPEEIAAGLIGLAEVQLERGQRKSARALLTDAESAARGISEPVFGSSAQAALARTLAQLAEVQQRAGNTERAVGLAAEARKAAAALSAVWERGMTAAMVEATLGDLEAAVAATAVDRDQHTRQRAVGSLYALRSHVVRRPVDLAIRAGDLDRATRLAEQLDPQFRDQAMADLCGQRCRRGEAAAALTLCLRVHDARERLELLLGVIHCAHQAGDPVTAEAAVDEAAGLRPGPNEYWIKPQAHTALARAYGYAGNGETARALLAQMLLSRVDRTDSSQDARAATAVLMAKIAEAEGRAGRKPNALALIAEAERRTAPLDADGFPASLAATEIVQAQVSCGQFSAAAKTADRFQGSRRVDLLLSAAQALQVAGRTSLARRLRRSAAAALPDLPEGYDRNSAVERLAFFDAYDGDKKAVLQAVTEMATHAWDHPSTITYVLASLAHTIARRGDLEGALAVIGSAPTPVPAPVYNSLWDRPAFDPEQAIAFLAEDLARDGQLQQAENLARTRLRKGGTRDFVLVTLADQFAAQNQATSALGLVRLAEDDSTRAQILAAAALAESRVGDSQRSRRLFRRAITAVTGQRSLLGQDPNRVLVKISAWQARAGASSEALATVARIEEAVSRQGENDRLVLDALIEVGTELGTHDPAAAAAAFDRAIVLCSSTHDLKRVGVAEARAGLTDRAVQRAVAISRLSPSGEAIRAGFVFATGSLMEIPDILDELVSRHDDTAAMQVIPLCSRKVDDALRGSLALSRLYPDHAHGVASAVASLIQ